MATASGSNGRLTYVKEAAYGDTPNSPSMKKLIGLTFGESIGASMEEVRSNAIAGGRAVAEVRGGNFTISGSSGFELSYVNQEDVLEAVFGNVVKTADTPSVGLTKRVYKRGTLPSITIEKGFTDISQYFVYTGMKADKLSLSVNNTGLIAGSIDWVGQSSNASTSSLGIPSSAVLQTVLHSDAKVYQSFNNFTTESELKCNEFSFEITNTLDAESGRIVGYREIQSLTEGIGELTGTLKVQFENLTQYNLWKNETSFGLRIECGDIDTKGIEFKFPKCLLSGSADPKLESSGAVFLTFNFRAILDEATNSDVIVTLVNNVA